MRQAIIPGHFFIQRLMSFPLSRNFPVRYLGTHTVWPFELEDASFAAGAACSRHAFIFRRLVAAVLPLAPLGRLEVDARVFHQCVAVMNTGIVEFEACYPFLILSFIFNLAVTLWCLEERKWRVVPVISYSLLQ